ncbi:SagB-type dehydrogenase domain-containing protein [Caloranaerobacter azorensis DSM 13643]|uniref:SagB-type dehydrogenase domain-containing protein n=1 Tax=Caloranaerobacter azorensis DSM 13643 TaxID=1121264 RepID=A0A1M5UQS2_9FIRM|nr:SagB/ThcOx family dehydrogenase [Caloranaerobacter azorensis]SHH65345.1 SagB-type dehydrogenase domain-containing protein [Caloranaerobacter azorensis DSM 13643]
MLEKRILWNFKYDVDKQTYLYRLYHENSKHSPLTQSVKAPRSNYMELIENEAREERKYDKKGEVVYIVPYVSELEQFDIRLTDALLKRRTSWNFKKQAISTRELIAFLGYSFGISDREYNLKTYPSGGRFYPVDIYLVPTKKMIRNSEILKEERAYRYNQNSRELLALHRVNLEELNSLTSSTDIGDMSFDDALFLVFLVGNMRYIEKKYNSLTYRLIYKELGHIGQNIMLVATMLGMSTVPLGGFFEDRINKFLRLDKTYQSNMYTFIVG